MGSATSLILEFNLCPFKPPQYSLYAIPFKSNTSCVFGDDLPLLFGVKIPVKFR